MPDGLFEGEEAAQYDEDVAPMFAPEVLEPTVDFLAGLSGGTRALELAVGTGRVALPLAARGVEVVGVERSADMIARLRAKPGGRDLTVLLGDMVQTRAPGEFGLVYLVFNSLGNLLTQDAQVACFENAAAHLAPGGFFVVELFIPNLRRLPPGETLAPFAAPPATLGVDEYDLLRQRLVSHHVLLRKDGSVTVRRTPQRYAWPAELDLMARLAGLRLCERWADFRCTPFGSESRAHVSVWVKPFTQPGVRGTRS